MLRLPPVLCLAALCLLMALPAAQAQVPTDPTMAVSVEATPKSPTILLGGSQAFKVNVVLSTQYIFCSSPGTVTVKLDLKDNGLPGVVGTIPTSIDVPIRANVQPPAAQTASGGNSTAAFLVTVARTTTPDHDHSFTITATTPAALPSGCNGVSPNMPKPATGTADVMLRTGPPMRVNGTGTMGSACTGCTTSKASFFVPLQLQVAVLLAVGLLRRR